MQDIALVTAFVRGLSQQPSDSTERRARCLVFGRKCACLAVSHRSNCMAGEGCGEWGWFANLTEVFRAIGTLKYLVKWPLP